MTTMPESFFGWVTFLLHQYGDVLLKGACVTLLLAIVGTLIGCVIGLVVGIIQTIPEDPKASAAKKALVKVTQLVLNAYVELFRGTPMIVQAMVVYYGAMSMFNIDMSPMFAGFLVVSINTGAYMAETVISVTELYFASKSAAGVYYRYFEIFFITCVIYFIMTFTASRLLRWWEGKMDGPKDYQLVSFDPMQDPCGHFPVNVAGKKRKDGNY